MKKIALTIALARRLIFQSSYLSVEAYGLPFVATVAHRIFGGSPDSRQPRDCDFDINEALMNMFPRVYPKRAV